MESLKITEYMNRRPAKLRADMSVAEAVELLILTKQTGGPVIDHNNMVIGFLSEQDCLATMITSSYYREQVCSVEDIMTKDVLCVKGYNSILEVADILLKAKPKMYPVIDDNKVLIGTINRSEVLNAIDVQLRSGYSS